MRKDEMAMRLMSEFPNVEYQMGYQMLAASNFNYDAVANDVR